MKSKIAAALLALFLGGLGIHKFYLGRGGIGVIYLLFCWTLIPAVIAFIEGIILLVMSEQEFNHKYNRVPNTNAPYQNRQPNAGTANTNISDELEKLHSLKEKGIISQEEFDYKKKRLLQS